MHNLILHYLKGKALIIALIAFMLICQALAFCAVSYGVDAALKTEAESASAKVESSSAAIQR
jgi:hypothetical protein